MSRIGVHELPRLMQVWRAVTTDDGAGGQLVDVLQVGEVRVRVSQPSAAERTAGGQRGAGLDAVIYALPDDDVRRGDELRGGGETYRVTSTVTPSEPAYLRVECERVQSEGA